jgi:hypothetical protein
MELPMANATLTKVEGGGFAEDYDRAKGGDDPKWTGSEGVYFNEASERVSSGESTEIVIGRSVVVSSDLAVDWKQGDTLTLTRGEEEIVADVRRIKKTEYPGAPGVVRLHLDDA